MPHDAERQDRDPKSRRREHQAASGQAAPTSTGTIGDEILPHPAERKRLFVFGRHQEVLAEFLREVCPYHTLRGAIRARAVDAKTGKSKQVEGLICEFVPLDNRQSLYLQHGDWFAQLCGGLCLVCLGTGLWNWMGRRK